jgi:hypothetical protein
MREGGHLMSGRTLVLGLVLLILGLAACASARGDSPAFATADPLFAPADRPSDEGLRGARLETLWIFWANFDDPDEPDNQGWTTFDQSGTLGQDNYWHHDTIRLTEDYLGDSTWWCGTYNICWRQARGYGNNWIQELRRTLSPSEMGDPGDVVELEFDQRYAMERLYDYGYVEVSGDGGGSWTTLAVYNNTGFQGAGVPHNWDHPSDGHVTHDLSSFAGQEVELRFRFESDGAYSAQDQYDNPQHSVRDGAWQIDNLTVTVNGTPTFYDDSESGNMGWIHEPRDPSGQTGVTFFRGEFDVDFETGRPFTCEDRVGWMYAAVDPFTSKMVDGQQSWLMSPPIDISGASRIVGHWDYWLDMPEPANDLWNLELASNDIYECVTDPDGFVDEDPGWWYGDPGWRTRFDSWDAFTGNDWLAILVKAINRELPEPGAEHWAGFFGNRFAVGIPSGDPGTAWETDTWNSFNDWFQEDLAEAALDTARVLISDDDDIASAYLMASNDGGATWDAYAMQREAPESDWWLAPPPMNQLVPRTEIRYYYEATDGVGNVSTLPSDAPRRAYEFSILPLEATVSDPGLLLVDKHGYYTPGESRYFGVYHRSEYYYTEMLEILGYDWEVYDVEVPSGSRYSEGPDTTGMKYYDTQIWFTNRYSAYTLWPIDQWSLIQWLAEGADGKERNLLLTGNNIGYELKEAGDETLSFYDTWLASNYISDAVGVVTVDSCPGIEDHAGGSDFMTYDDGSCMLRGGCPVLSYFDVVDARSGIVGNEVAADYVKQSSERVPAGVAYTHQTLDYQTVNLGFGIEFMMDGMLPNGYYRTGIQDRANIMGNILTYFGKTPTGPGTDVAEGGFRNALSHAYPNPFNPATEVAYSVREGGPVTIEVFNVAGRVVRTLLRAELEAGAEGSVIWDGLDDRGERCASGVYFCRMVTPDFAETRKLVMLK